MPKKELLFWVFDGEIKLCCGKDRKRVRAMDTDDLEPVVKKTEVKNLEVMSIEALGEYIDELQSEIRRVEAEIEMKKQARQGAEEVFK